MPTIVIEPKKRLLTVDGESYPFKEITMLQYAPVWLVTLENDKTLVLNFLPSEVKP